MARKMFGSLERFFRTAVVFGAIVNLYTSQTKANIVTETVPAETNVLRDGVTEYRMDVYGDSTQHPTDQIAAFEWDVVVPPFLTITRAELPDQVNNPSQNPLDYFHAFMMESNPGGTWNRVDSTVNGGELETNVRATKVLNFAGPSNTSGLLGSVWYTVNPDAPLGPAYFDMNEVRVTRTPDFFEYSSPDIGSGVTINNHPLDVRDVPEPSSLGLLAVGAGALASRRRRSSREDYSEKVSSN